MVKKKLLEHTIDIKKEGGYPRNKVILLVVCVILVTIVIAGFVYNIVSVFDMQRYSYHINVSEKGEIGLNIDTDALYFGKIPHGGSGYRYIDIVNSHAKPLKILITFSGDGSEWIAPEDNGFVLNPAQNRSIAIIANIPDDAQLGEYAGTMSIFFKKI